MILEKIIIKIYLKDMKKPLCTAILTSEDQLQEFLNELNGENRFIEFGQVAFNKTEFKYYTVQYKR